MMWQRRDSPALFGLFPAEQPDIQPGFFQCPDKQHTQHRTGDKLSQAYLGHVYPEQRSVQGVRFRPGQLSADNHSVEEHRRQ